MHVLFAISVLALAALLWASAAIVQHVRRSRRRRRRLQEENAQLTPAATGPLGLSLTPAAPPLAFTEPSLFRSAPLSRELAEWEASPTPPPPFPDAAASINASLAAGFPATPSMLEPETLAIVSALEAATLAAARHSVEEAGKAAAPSQPQPSAEPEVIAEPASRDTEPSAAPEAIAVTSEEAAPTTTPPDPGSLAAIAARVAADPPSRSVRASSAKHPLASLVAPLERPDWAYFNKDMGDISDPEAPRGRRRDIKAIKARHKSA